MPLSPYHQQYSEHSEEELFRRSSVKEHELNKIFNAVEFKSNIDPLRVAVLGCADARLVEYHRHMFEKVLGKRIDLTTFDITIDHLAGQKGVVQHDCTLPFPNPPYDVMYSHVLLKFIETEKQWDVIIHSYEALRAPGLAIHIFNEEDVVTTDIKQNDGYWSVPLERWTKALKDNDIQFRVIRWDIALETLPIPIRGLKGGALILFKES